MAALRFGRKSLFQAEIVGIRALAAVFVHTQVQHHALITTTYSITLFRLILI